MTVPTIRPDPGAPIDDLRAITFDVTHTLIHCPRVPEIYAEVLVRHGIDTSAAEVGRWFPVVWREMACRTETGRDRFAAHPEGGRGWWQDFLGRLADYLESPVRPTRFTAAELYQAFARADAWEVYPEVRPTLARLQEQGIRLGVISNWDDRLGPLLTRLDLTRFFDAFVVSSRLGVEKPDPRIFQYALDLLETPAEQAAHVGDSLQTDVEGALAVGMRAFHLLRTGTGQAGPEAALGTFPEGFPELARDTEDLPDLAPLAERVGGR